MCEFVSLSPLFSPSSLLSPSHTQPDNDISAYTYERTLVMEQRNEMLNKLRLTKRQKKGDVQHILSRSFSRKQSSFDVGTPVSPPYDITIPVPQFPRIQTPPSQARKPPSLGSVGRSDPFAALGESETDNPTSETVSIGDLSIEPRVVGLPPLLEDATGEREEEEEGRRVFGRDEGAAALRAAATRRTGL